MSILDLTADEAVRASINRGPTQPYVPPKRSAWGGALTAVPRAVGVAAGEVGANIADTFGALQQIRDTPYQRGQTSWGDIRLKSDLGDTVRDYWRDFKPDQATASTAEKLLFGFARSITTLIPATVAAGPAGAFAAGLNEWMTTADELQAQGVDRETALKAGLVQGAGMASAALPLLGQTLPQTAALYVAGGPGGFMAQQALTRKILENAGQTEIAASYDPFDPVGLTVAAALPGFFTYRGIKGQQAAAKAAKIAQAVKAEADFQAGPLPSEPTPIAMASREVIDAAMVQNLRDSASRADAEMPARMAEAYRGPVTENPNFRAWFGDSKVVDAEGKPLVVYHGTTADITQFDAARRGENTGAESAKKGFFFTPDPVTAESYAHYAATDAKVAALLREAEVAEARGDWDTYDAKVAQYEALDKSFQDPQNRLAGQNTVPVYLSMSNPLRIDAKGENAAGFDIPAAIREAVRGKYDGLIIDNLDDAAGLVDRTATHYVVFKSEQIKSAIGNSGRFDPNSASLTDPVPVAPLRPTPAEATLPKVSEAPGAIGRMAALEREAADFPVRLDQEGQPVRFADDLAEVRRLAAEGTDDTLGTLDADLLRVAVECAISGG